MGEIQIFHVDRGSECKNQIIEEILEGFEIQRSLSQKGCPYDNAVAEATYKIIKTEFVDNQMDELEIKFADYVNWFSGHRIHSSLGYRTPSEYQRNTLKNFV